MEDKQIVELFLERNERAISESEKKYGRFCGSIASNILRDKEDVREVLFGKEKFSGVLDIDTANISTAPDTTQSIRFRGASGKCDLPEYTDYRYLITDDTLSFSPADGVTVTGIGYIDGALHIQTYYEDILHTDNHGYINLIDKLGNMIEPYSYYDEVNISFWDSENKGCYDEKIIKMPYDEVGEYQLYGEFVTSKGYVSGDWEITFPIK